MREKASGSGRSFSLGFLIKLLCFFDRYHHWKELFLLFYFFPPPFPSSRNLDILIAYRSATGLSLKTQQLTFLFLTLRLLCSVVMESDVHTLLDLLTLGASP